jgi:hypothetical protein
MGQQIARGTPRLTRPRVSWRQNAEERRERPDPSSRVELVRRDWEYGCGEKVEGSR